MKLKKIASLALAGIMAVSMLAGCSGSSSSSEPTTPPDTTVTSGIAAAANNARTPYAKDVLKLSYTESASLAEMLETVAQDEYSKDSEAIESAAGSNSYGAAAMVANTNDMYKKISQMVTGGASGNIDDFMSANDGVRKFVRIFTVGGNYSIGAAGNAVATLASGFNGLEIANYLPATTDDKNVSYTADVAAVKVTSNDHPEKSAWVVAVVYTQTVVAI